MLTHCPLQTWLPPEQVVAQAPLEHACPLGQTWLQVPQLLGSLLVLTHDELHRVSLPQLCAHRLDWQYCPAGQDTLQLPQSELLLVVLTQEPLQLTVPLEQVVEQVPPVQT